MKMVHEQSNGNRLGKSKVRAENRAGMVVLAAGVGDPEGQERFHEGHLGEVAFWWVIVLVSRPPTFYTAVSEKMSQSNKRNDFNI